MTQIVPPLVEQLKLLEQLQELDLQVDRLKKERDALPVALKASDEALAKIQASLTVKKAAHAEQEKTHRQTKAALELNRERLTRSESRLEGIQNSQEFQAVNKEIEQLKKLNATLDQQMEKFNADLDAVTKEVDALSAQQSEIQQKRDAEAATVAEKTKVLNQDIDRISADKKKYSDPVDKRTLSQYDRVRVARGGLGIVPAASGRCKGCNMVVPPQLYNEVQKALTLHQCPSCHRILFVPKQQETVIEGSEAGSR